MTGMDPSGSTDLRRKGRLFAAVLACLLGCGPRPPAVSELNVVVVTLDTTRADRIGAFGGTVVPTPNLDEMAADGVRFSNAISTNPLTLPAHSSIFTGLYPFRHGVRHNGAYTLAPSAITLAERLRDSGFRTGAFVGSFVLDARFGLNQGFDTYSAVASDPVAIDFLRPSSLQRPAASVNEAAFRWLDGIETERFFAWVHYYDPHHPYAPPETPGVTLHGSGYDREISYVDHCFGELVRYLRERSWLDRTILVVVGDHGESLGAHGERTHGLFVYEPALHVPFFLRAPGIVPKNSRYESPVSVVDVAPTVLGLLRLSPVENADGRSLVSDRGGLRAEDPSRFVYAETWMPRIEFGWSELTTIRSRRYKLIRAPRLELYDLETDPLEELNLASVDRAVAENLTDALAALVAEGGSRQDVVAAKSVLSAEEISKLQSLGYLRGGIRPASEASGLSLPDPKDHVAEAMRLEEAEEALRRGDLRSADEGFGRVLLENAHNHAALLGRARALLRSGELSRAEEAALAALAASAEDPLAPGTVADNARGLLATILALTGRREEGARYLDAVSTATGGGGSPKSPVVVLLAGAKNRDEARAIVDLAARLRPSDPWSWASRVEFARKVGDTSGAVETARHLASLGRIAAPALIDVGMSAQAAGEIALALSCFKEARRADPNHPDVLGYLGTARLASGDLDGAERDFLEVRRLRPADPRVPYYLANIALLRDDESNAKRLVDEALAKDPRFVPPVLNYARWLAEKGRIEDAIRATESALERRPGDPAAMTLLRELRRTAETEPR